MSKINDFLTETGTFFLATADGDQPRLRPLGLHPGGSGHLVGGEFPVQQSELECGAGRVVPQEAEEQ